MIIWKKAGPLCAGTLLLLLILRRQGNAAGANADFTPALASSKAWDNAGEFSYLSANGNSRSTTTSVKNTFHYHWNRTRLELTGDALGASNGGGVTSEQYDAGEKVSWLQAGKNYTFERFAWNKNRFAGIRNQYNAGLGLGRYLVEASSDTLLTELGPGYANTEYTAAPRRDYASGRAFANYTHVLSATAKFSQNLEYLHDFSHGKNYYFNTETGVIAAMTTHLSLKASYSWHRAGQPPAGFGKDDTITAATLILNF